VSNRWTEEEYAAYVAAANPTYTRRKSTSADPVISESAFQSRVLRCAAQHSWIAYHTHDSRGSRKGFPDLVLAKPGQAVLFVELKSHTGKLTIEQTTWLNVLGRCVGVEAYCWIVIEERLSQKEVKG
jgi:hypothetical protein